MKRALFAILVLWSGPVWACDTYTSVEKPAGVRLLIDEGLDLIVRENGVERRFATGSAGTGTNIRVAFPEDQKTEPMEITQEKGEYWLGPEKFVEFCKQ